MFIELYLIGILIGIVTYSDFWFSMILGILLGSARVAKTYEKIKRVYCELELRVGVAAVGGLIFKLAGF